MDGRGNFEAIKWLGQRPNVDDWMLGLCRARHFCAYVNQFLQHICLVFRISFYSLTCTTSYHYTIEAPKAAKQHHDDNKCLLSST